MRSAIHAASQQLERGPLMWMLSLYLHINEKSDDGDYDDEDTFWNSNENFQLLILVQPVLYTKNFTYKMDCESISKFQRSYQSLLSCITRRSKQNGVFQSLFSHKNMLRNSKSVFRKAFRRSINFLFVLKDENIQSLSSVSTFFFWKLSCIGMLSVRKHTYRQWCPGKIRSACAFVQCDQNLHWAYFCVANDAKFLHVDNKN